MKRIEDRFQKVANRILTSGRLESDNQDFEAIAELYSLSKARAEHCNLPEQDINIEGTVAGENFFP